jgi:hypothetical protein
MSGPQGATGFMDRVRALQRAAGEDVSALGAGLLAAVELGIATDSRSFSRLLGIEHALVLREIALLSAADGYLLVTARNPRTLRTSLALSPRTLSLLEQIRRGA